jgi:hypothetical protein
LSTCELSQTGKTVKQVRNYFQQRFGQEAFPKQTFLRWEHKRFAKGNIKDKPRTGRQSTRGRHYGLVEESVATSSQKWTRH